MSFLINPYSYGVSIPTGNLVFYLDLESNVDDNTGNFTPTNNGVTFASTGVKSGSLYGEWLNTGDNITIGDSDLLSFGDGTSDSPFSVSFWVYATSWANNPRLIDKRGAGGDEYRVLIVGSKVSFNCSDQSTGGRIFCTGNTTLTTSTWYHITCTYNGSGANTGLNIYVNGSDDSVTPGTSGTYTAMENGTSSLVIGKDNGGTSNTLQGRMDSIALWDKELNSAEVLAIYEKLNAGTELI